MREETNEENIGHTHEDQCEWHRMTRMTGPDCAVICNLINTHTHTHTHKGKQKKKGKKEQTQKEKKRNK